MAQTIFDQLKVFFEKTGKVDRTWSPFLMNRFFSMSWDFKTQQTAFRMNKFTFILGTDYKELLEAIYLINIPRMKTPFIKYIKKPSEKKDDNKELIEEFQKYFNWTDHETEINTPFIIQALENKEEVLQLLKFIGADETLYKKYKVKKEVVPEGLLRWAK